MSAGRLGPRPASGGRVEQLPQPHPQTSTEDKQPGTDDVPGPVSVSAGVTRRPYGPGLLVTPLRALGAAANRPMSSLPSDAGWRQQVLPHVISRLVSGGLEKAVIAEAHLKKRNAELNGKVIEGALAAGKEVEWHREMAYVKDPHDAEDLLSTESLALYRDKLPQLNNLLSMAVFRGTELRRAHLITQLRNPNLALNPVFFGVDKTLPLTPFVAARKFATLSCGFGHAGDKPNPDDRSTSIPWNGGLCKLPETQMSPPLSAKTQDDSLDALARAQAQGPTALVVYDGLFKARHVPSRDEFINHYLTRGYALLITPLSEGHEAYVFVPESMLAQLQALKNELHDEVQLLPPR